MKPHTQIVEFRADTQAIGEQREMSRGGKRRDIREIWRCEGGRSDEAELRSKEVCSQQ